MTTTTTARMSMEELSTISLLHRQDRARIRRCLASGSLCIADVLRDPPVSVAKMTVLDALRLIRTHNMKGTVWQAQLGRRAVSDGVNLLVKIEDASARTIEWAIANAPSPIRRVAA